MKLQPHRPATKGILAFTMAEVVVAILIVTVGAAGLMSCFGYGFRVIQRVRENQRATQIILEKAETLRLYSWDQVERSWWHGFIPWSFTATYDGDAVPGNYSGTIYYGTVTIWGFPYNTSYQDRLRRVDLTLRWTSQGITRRRSMTTFIAQDGIQNYVY